MECHQTSGDHQHVIQKEHEIMSSHLSHAFAQARVDELRRAGAARTAAPSRHRPGRPDPATTTVTLRFGGAADEPALERVARLDSAATPAQPVLLAEVGGQLLAALSLVDGAVVADPFHRTADLVDLLRARARQLHGETTARRRGRSRSWFRLPVGASR
jgi:hypothetical protein